MRRWLRYAVTAVGVTGAALGAGWPLLDDEAMRGLVLAAAIALPLQLAVFGGLVAQHRAGGPGSPGFLGMWVGGTLLRLAVVAGAAFWIAGMEEVDLLTALLGLVGLLFVLLLLEPWMLRGSD